MVLSDSDIIKFQEIYKKNFGKEISKQEAYEQGIKLLTLVKVIWKPMTQADWDRIQARRKTTAAPSK
jgi:hypothetical protein